MGKIRDSFSEMTPKLSFKGLTRIELAERGTPSRQDALARWESPKAWAAGWSQTKEFEFCLKTESI